MAWRRRRLAHHRRRHDGRPIHDRGRAGYLALSERRPLRLAFLADPNSVHTRRWIAWFAHAGHDVHLVDLFGTDLEPGLPDGVHMERAAGDLARLLRTLEPDVVHAHYVRRWGWQAARAGVHPLVVTPWGSDLLRTPWWGLRTRFWNRFALRSADLITVSSEGMRRAAVNAGARAKRVELVNHGVDTTRFSPGPPRATMVEADDAPIIVSPRTVRPLYRQEVVVDAVAAITSSERRPLLVMSARGADPTTLAAVRERAAARGIDDRLRILDDVAHDELPDLFRLADVVVSVPDTDSFPLTV
ncbi:MAG: glycosyltransferase, partial [Chloroflexi bacterium]|nr:glycosyltransferase [Chloroflexota bacterium]